MLANWLLPPDSSKLLPKHTCTKSYSRTTNTNLPHTLTYTHTYIYLYICIYVHPWFLRRSEPSTAQFRNFYGKSSLIKFNELWKRQQISRGQLCCKVCPGWFFLWVDVTRTGEYGGLLRLLSPTSVKRRGHCFDLPVLLRLVNWRMWFLWVGIIKCGIKSVAHVEV